MAKGSLRCEEYSPLLSDFISFATNFSSPANASPHPSSASSAELSKSGWSKMIHGQSTVRRCVFDLGNDFHKVDLLEGWVYRIRVFEVFIAQYVRKALQHGRRQLDMSCDLDEKGCELAVALSISSPGVPNNDCKLIAKGAHRL